MKKIAVLGSTGSIGTQTLDVVRNNEDMKVVALAAGSNIDCLEKQIKEFVPSLVCVWNPDKAEELRVRLKASCYAHPISIIAGMEGLLACSTIEEADVVLTAVVGMIGIQPTIAAIKAGKDIALANKETLVTAGHLIMPLAKEYGVNILPVDSEHSAIFQALNGEKNDTINKILLTASGGPFRGRTTEQLRSVTLKDALKHPNWSMGKKITIDSATLVNKGLEVLEAKWLFDVSYDQIQVVVQPQSIIHSMVEFIDGGIIAQLGTPDMRLPIQYALTYPVRRSLGGDRLDFWTLSQITFEKPDLDTFKGLKLAYTAGKIGGSMPTVLNAANELAVAKFLQEEITFLEIYDILEYAMDTHEVIPHPSVEQILAIEADTYDKINRKWKR